eukprot:7085431-Prymnesium_polylepis.1
MPQDGGRLRRRAVAARPRRTAAYEREGCTGRVECRVWATVLPCTAPAVAVLSRVRAGCWARAPEGCPQQPALQLHGAHGWRRLTANWSRQAGEARGG